MDTNSNNRLDKEEKRCPECNAELSYCGPVAEDGIPTLDCMECILRDKIEELEFQVKERDNIIQDFTEMLFDLKNSGKDYLSDPF